MEWTPEDERTFWARERALLVEKIRFSVEREEAKQARLELLMNELREQQSRWHERFRVESEETILGVRRECETRLHMVCDQRDKAVFDCENLALSLRSIEMDRDWKSSSWQTNLALSQGEHKQITCETQHWQQRHDEIREEWLQRKDAVSEERREWTTERDEIERQANLVLDEQTQEWSWQSQQLAAECEEWRRQNGLMEEERDAWRDKGAAVESERDALICYIEKNQEQVRTLESNFGQEELAVEALKVRIDECETSHSHIREGEAAMDRQARNCELNLRREFQDASRSHLLEQEALHTHHTQLAWRLKETLAQQDLESQRLANLELRYQSERKAVSRLEYELKQQHVRAEGCVERLEAERSYVKQQASDQQRHLLADLEKRLISSEEIGLQHQRRASDAERRLQQAIYVERDLMAELKKNDFAHQDHARLLEEVMSDTQLLATTLASHQRKASDLNETICHNAKVVARSTTQSPRDKVIFSNLPYAVKAKPEEHSFKAPTYSTDNSYVDSLIAKYTTHSALSTPGRAAIPATSQMKKKIAPSERFSIDSCQSQRALKTPAHSSTNSLTSLTPSKKVTIDWRRSEGVLSTPAQSSNNCAWQSTSPITSTTASLLAPQSLLTSTSSDAQHSICFNDNMHISSGQALQVRIIRAPQLTASASTGSLQARGY